MSKTKIGYHRQLRVNIFMVDLYSDQILDASYFEEDVGFDGKGYQMVFEVILRFLYVVCHI